MATTSSMCAARALTPSHAAPPAHATLQEWAGLAFHQKALNAWGIITSSYSAVLALSCALYLIATRQQQSPALAALAITYAYVLPYFVAVVAQLCV